MVDIILKCSYFFSVYIKGKIASESLKLSCLIDLFYRLLSDLGDIDILPLCNDHPSGVEIILKKVLTILAKLFLKNSVLSSNDQIKENKQELAKINKYDGPSQVEKFYM